MDCYRAKSFIYDNNQPCIMAYEIYGFGYVRSITKHIYRLPSLFNKMLLQKSKYSPKFLCK